MKRISLILILICAATVLFSQSVWTGNAAVSNEKEFESYYSEDSATGKYLGASNSFPGSTEVTVTNPRNGKTVSVSIVKRLSQPGLFLVLSPEAGDEIELPDDDILNVEVVVRRKNEEIFSNYSDDLPYSEDPDLNPSAELAPESVFTEDTSADLAELTAAKEVEEEIAPEPEIEAPVESSVNEYIPPVVLNSEGTPYEEGYDPLVLIEGEEESGQPEEVVEIVDEPELLAESIMSTVSEPAVPLPDTYDETDLPESYEPELLEETVIDSSPEVVGVSPESESFSNTLENSPIVAEPELMESELVETGIIEPEDLDSEFMEAGIDDLLITETAEQEPEIEQPELSDLLIAEPEIEELEFEEVVIAEPEIEEIVVPETSIVEPGSIVAETFDSESIESVIIEPDVSEPIVSDSEVAKPFVVEPIVIEPDVFESIVSDTEVSEPDVIEPEVTEPIVIEPEVSESVVIAPETVVPEETPENVIYFLTPGDFRPPPQSEEKKEKEKEKVKEKTIVALPVERSKLEEMIVTELRNGGSYLQLGTYGSMEVLYTQIERISEAYPSIVLTMGEEDNQLYKLLIGPISRDEKGIIMTRFRSMGYGDAFLYSPR